MKHVEDTWPKKIKDEVFIHQLLIEMGGVNLYSLKNTDHYMWLVVMINNSITLWFSMNNELIILALIIPSRR